MASILVERGKVYICSGSRVSVVDNINLENPIILQPFAKSGDFHQNGSQQDGDAESQNGGKTQNGSKEPETLVCMGLSSYEDYLAVCGDNKKLVVYHQNKLVCETILSRKASKLLFTKDGSDLIIADKNGDIYSFKHKLKTSDNKPTLVLGHLSMLLDVQLSPSNRHILTADRDEKIRLSMFPNAYNINNFCLGHTDFVSSISLCGEKSLVSGSGDGTIRLWNFLEGLELASREVYKDVDVKLDRVVDKDSQVLKDVNNDLKDLDIERKRNEPSDIPAVIKIMCLYEKSLVLVHLEGLNGLLLYSINQESKCISKEQLVDLKETLVDFDLDDNNTLTCLALSHGSQAVLNQFVFKDGVYALEKEVEMGAHLAEIKEEDVGDLSNLHKRWFDNMKEYMDRKEIRQKNEQIRIESFKSKSADVPEKKRKVETTS